MPKLFGYSATQKGTGTLLIPRTPRTGKRGVILCHGAGGAGSYWATGSTGVGGAVNAMRLAAGIASAGIPCYGPQLNNDAWGNDSVVNSGQAIDTEWANLRTWAGCASDKVLLVGISMGSLNALRYMAAQPTKCAGAVVILPLVNMADFYGNNRGGYQTSVAAAWSVTAPAALPARADPSTNVAAIATSGQILGYYSSADALMTPSLEPTFAAAVNSAGGSAAFSDADATHGHSDLSTGSVVDNHLGDVVKFLIANGA